MKENKFLLRLIYIISVAVPLLVALLIFNPLKLDLGVGWIRQLPLVNALLNSLTALLLLLALIAIKRKKIIWHRNLMLSGLVLGSLFLVSYVLYHSSVNSTVFGDLDHNGILDPVEADKIGSMRGIYLGILLSHIGLSIVVVPLVLMAFYFALSNQIPRHKKLVRFTYPIWLYVSISGILVYVMISPYYF